MILYPLTLANLLYWLPSSIYKSFWVLRELFTTLEILFLIENVFPSSFQEYFSEWLLFFEQRFYSPIWTSPFSSDSTSTRYPIYLKLFHIISISFIVANIHDTSIILSNHYGTDSSSPLVRVGVSSSSNRSPLVGDQSSHKVISITDDSDSEKRLFEWGSFLQRFFFRCN